MGEVIRILHLSDFHLCPERRWDSDPVLKGLTKSIGELKSKGLAPDIVALTGDIADRGRPEDYAEARRWIDEGLRVALTPNFPDNHILVIPGNHDVDRPKVNRMAQALQADLLNSKDQFVIAEVMRDAHQRDTLLQRHLNYLNFVNGFRQPGNPREIPWWPATLELHGQRLHVAGLCSSWKSWEKEEYGKLLVGRCQVNELLADADKADWSVALIHHPWKYIAEFDADDAEAKVHRDCHLVLRGHLHKQEARAIHYANNTCLELAAGSAYAGSEYPNAFQLAELSLRPRTVRVHFWLWKEGRWIVDHNAVPDSTDGTVTFNLDRTAMSASGIVQARSADSTKYLRALRDRTAYILVRGLHVSSGKAHPPFPIDDLYIPLMTADHVEAIPKKENAKDQRVERATGGEPRIALEEALRKHRLLVILGDPGAGKSTFLNRIACLLSRAGLGEKPEVIASQLGLNNCPFPILIRLSELAQHITATLARKEHDGPTLADSPEWIIHFLVAGSGGLDEVFFRRQLEGGTAALLLDGLDEAPTDLQRKTLSSLVRKASREAFEQCRFVLTSRPAAYDGETVLPNFVQVRIEGLDNDAIEKFLVRWYETLLSEIPTGHQRHLRELLEALRSRPEIRRVARNPLMLTALAVIHWHEKRLPEGRADLYESILRWLAESREEAKPGRLSFKSCISKHQELALAMQDHPDGRQVQVPRFWAASQIAPEWPDEPEPKRRIALAEDFLNQEEVDSGIIVRRGDFVRFWHLTFQEYLAARALGADDDRRTKLYQDNTKLYQTQWKEVVLLLGGVLHHQGKKRVDAMFSAILERLGARASLADQARCFGLLGALVQDLSPDNYKPEDPRYQQLGEAVMGIFDAKRSVLVAIKDAIQAAEALGAIGDPRLADLNSPDLWVAIPAGEFRMGSQKKDTKKPNYDEEAFDDETPDHPVHLSAYRIGKYPVTVTEYQRFVDNDGYAVASHWKAGGFGQWLNPDRWDEQMQHSNRPVTGVSWYEAEAYAAWTGCRLPTEAEWERAARGINARRYPWGNDEPSPTLTNYSGGKVGCSTPVGVYPRGATPEGIQDLAGNVWEWCEDWYGKYSKDTQLDPKGPSSGDCRVLRGGSWSDYARNCRGAVRYWLRPDFRLDSVGFRLAAGT